MEQLIEWLRSNFQLFVVIAFIVLPILFNRKKKPHDRTSRKPVAPAGKPTGPSGTGSGREPDESTLESKVRRFFEDLVDEGKPEPKNVARTGAPAPGTGRAPSMPRLEPVDAPALDPKPLIFDIPEEGGTLVPAPAGRTEDAPNPYEDLYGDSILADEETLPHARSLLTQEDRDELVNQDLSDHEISDTHFEVIGESENARDRLELGKLVTGTREDLQRAFVLKEILDRPVALRDEPFAF